MVIYIDIDETICEMGGDATKDRDYSCAVPLKDNISKANALYDGGHSITYWTARGSLTGIDWLDLTKKQLKKWGVKYHELKLDKPHYDLFIDDKNLNTRDWK